jgi:hypothetical protein
MSEHPSTKYLSDIAKVVNDQSDAISGKTALEFFIKSPGLLRNAGDHFVLDLILNQDSEAAKFFSPMFRTGEVPNSQTNENSFSTESSEEITRLTMSNSPIAHIANKSAKPAVQDQPAHIQNIGETPVLTPSTNRARRSRDRLEDALYAPRGPGTRRGTIYHDLAQEDNETESENEENSESSVEDPEAQTQPTDELHEEADQAAPVNAELACTLESYQRRLEWLINCRTLTEQEMNIEVRSLDMVDRMLNATGKYPTSPQTAVQHSPTTSTTSSERDSMMARKETRELKKELIERKKTAMKLLKHWFHPSAIKMCPYNIWTRAEPSAFLIGTLIYSSKTLNLLE